MAKLGYTLFSELHGPKALVDQARQAEAVGFDFAVIPTTSTRGCTATATARSPGACSARSRRQRSAST